MEVEFPGFKIHQVDRETKTGGGICTFAKEDLKVERPSNLSYYGKWITYAMVENPNKKLEIFPGLYRLLVTECQPCFDIDFSEALSLNKPVYILGAPNCDMLDGNVPACQSVTKFYSSPN